MRVWSKGLILLNVGITTLKFTHAPSSFPSPPPSLLLSCRVTQRSNHVKSFSLSLTLSFAALQNDKKVRESTKSTERCNGSLINLV